MPEEKSEQNIFNKTLDNIKDRLSGSNKAPPLEPLPKIAPLVASADITETWEAVERFPACLLLTDPILSNVTENYTAVEVEFNIKSNDQGWCNEDNFEGAPLSVSGLINTLSTV